MLEKLSKLIVPAVAAATITAIGFGLMEIQSLRTRMSELEATGAVQAARIAECRELGNRIITETSTFSSGQERARWVFERRGCVEVEAATRAPET